VTVSTKPRLLFEHSETLVWRGRPRARSCDFSDFLDLEIHETTKNSGTCLALIFQHFVEENAQACGPGVADTSRKSARAFLGLG
jgi:hypothetical protein